MWSEGQLLIDHRNATAAGVQGVSGDEPLPVKFDLPAIRQAGATEDFHERAFARSVFTDEGVDLTGRDLERNVFECVSRAEAFAHSRHSQARGHSFRYLAIGG